MYCVGLLDSLVFGHRCEEDAVRYGSRDAGRYGHKYAIGWTYVYIGEGNTLRLRDETKGRMVPEIGIFELQGGSGWGGKGKGKGRRSQPRKNRGTGSASQRSQNWGGVDEFGKREGTATGREKKGRMEQKGWETGGAVAPVPGSVQLGTEGTTTGVEREGRLRWRAVLNRLFKAKEGSGEQGMILATVGQIAGEVLTRYSGEVKEVVGFLGGKLLAPHMDGDRIKDFFRKDTWVSGHCEVGTYCKSGSFSGRWAGRGSKTRD